MQYFLSTNIQCSSNSLLQDPKASLLSPNSSPYSHILNESSKFIKKSTKMTRKYRTLTGHKNMENWSSISSYFYFKLFLSPVGIMFWHSKSLGIILATFQSLLSLFIQSSSVLNNFMWHQHGILYSCVFSSTSCYSTDTLPCFFQFL